MKKKNYQLGKLDCVVFLMNNNKNILIKNIYYMLSYAFGALNKGKYEDLAIETFDEMYDLLADIFCKGIGVQLKRGLYREYISRVDDLSTMRGKLNFSGTIRNHLLKTRVLTCEYDEFSENNIYNQIIKSTVMILLKNLKLKSKYKEELKKQMIFFSEVDEINLTRVRWSDIKFQRNNKVYRVIISICQLITEGMLMTTDKGSYKLANFIDEQRMSKLYEKFVLEYYKKHFPELKVTSSQISWFLDDGMRAMLPKMQSDIHIQKDNKVLIIDTKYYSSTTQKRFDKYTIHSNNLYQIFTYVKNKDYEFGDEEHCVSGMILYAKTEEQMNPNVVYQMHGNQITVKTLDLNREFNEISKQLNEIVKNHFKI